MAEPTKTSGYCIGCNKNTILTLKFMQLWDDNNLPFNRPYFECGWCGFQNAELREVREDYPDVRHFVLQGINKRNG